MYNSSTELKSFIEANLNNPAAIAAAMQQYGISPMHIARALGATPQQVLQYMQNAQSQGIQFPGMDEVLNTISQNSFLSGFKKGDRIFPDGSSNTIFEDRPALSYEDMLSGNFTPIYGQDSIGVGDASSLGPQYLVSYLGALPGGRVAVYSPDGTYMYDDDDAGSFNSDDWKEAATEFAKGAAFVYGASLLGPAAGAGGAGAGATGGGISSLGQLPPLTASQTAALTSVPAMTTGSIAPLTTTGLGLGSVAAVGPGLAGASGASGAGAAATTPAVGLPPSGVENQVVQVTGSRLPTSTLPGALPGNVPSSVPGLNPVVPGLIGGVVGSGLNSLGPGPGPGLNTPGALENVGNWLMDPRNWNTVASGLGLLDSLLNRPNPSSMPGNGFGEFNDWTPQQKPSVQAFFNRAPTPFVPPARKAYSGEIGFASGGSTSGALTELAEPMGHGGQDDVIDAKLAPGEYVFDADVVSALGDGDNKAGAAKLDAWRERLRSHKRSAPSHRIPPRAKDPEAYLRGKVKQ